MTPKRITLIGDGGWGTALACLLAENGHAATLWSVFPEVAAEIAATRENKRFLPGVAIPAGVAPASDLAEALTDCDLAVFSTPVVFLRDVAERAAPFFKGAGAPSAMCVSKGIERGTLLPATGVLREALGVERVGMLYGPSHAEEVARKRPTTVVAAARDMAFAEEIQSVFMNAHFRVYTSDDPVGVEVGAAVKNVIAIAAGICDGLNLGDNAKAALLTRGLVEIKRLGVSLGAQPETFAGLSGLGDLITTCVSPHGRNRRVGLEIGQGKTLAQVLKDMAPMIPEGVFTVESVCELAARQKVDMPISRAVHEVLVENKPPSQGVRELMTREPKSEKEW